MIRTYLLPVPSYPVQLVANLVDFDFETSWPVGSLNSSQVEVSHTHSIIKRTRLCGRYGGKSEKKRSDKRNGLKKERTEIKCEKRTLSQATFHQ